MNQPAPQVSPAPLPTQTAVGVAQANDGNTYVLIEVHRPSGIDVVFLSLDHAQGLALELDGATRQARTGLVVANGADLPTPAVGR